MATNQRHTNGTGSAARNGSANSARARAALQKRKKKRRIIIFAIEIEIILIMLGVLYVVIFLPKEGPKFTVIDPSEVVPSEIQQAKDEGESAMLGYMNIALFGVDATNEKQIEKNSRTDTIMIASINMDTGDIKLVSVYRDTYLNIGTDTYTKCNAAYAKGGPQQAIKMLNMNLDLDIENFVTVGYNALMDVIDGLGGVYVEVKENEIVHLNNYQRSIVAQWKYGVKLDDYTVSEKDFEVVKSSDYTPVTEAGYQLLNGLQATAYCRIRYVGNDYKRTERQRTVLKAIQDQAKKADLKSLTDVFNKVVKQVYTSLDQKDMLELLGKIADYRIAEEVGFPQLEQLTTGNIGASGNCIVPQDLVSNVEWLHQFLFEDEEYQVTSTVIECSEKIKKDTAQYLEQ